MGEWPAQLAAPVHPRDTRHMSYRTIELAWRPRNTTEWAIFTASRQRRSRRRNWTWPSKARWQRWASRPEGRYLGLSTQRAQQRIGEFCGALDSCRQLRRNGQAEARSPWRLRRDHDVVYTHQDARIRDGRLSWPHGRSGTVRVRLPDPISRPGRLMAVRLSYGTVRIVCEVPDGAARPRPVSPGDTAGGCGLPHRHRLCGRAVQRRRAPPAASAPPPAARRISCRSACMAPCAQVVPCHSRSSICAPGLVREARGAVVPGGHPARRSA
jgi:hypothetical protein